MRRTLSWTCHSEICHTTIKLNCLNQLIVSEYKQIECLGEIHLPYFKLNDVKRQSVFLLLYNLVSVLSKSWSHSFSKTIHTMWNDPLLVPYRWNRGGTIGFLAVCQSVCPSVRLSLRPSVRPSTRCPSTRFSGVFSAVLWDIDFKFGIWICLDIIQIKFEFRHAWPTFTGVIALCWNLVFRVFLCCLLRYWLEIRYMNLSLHNTDQVWVSLRLTNFSRSYCPFLKFSFPDFSLLSFEILTWN